MAIVAIPFLGAWLLYSAYIVWCKPKRRQVQLVRVGLLTAALAGITALHFYYYTSARAAGNYAEQLVSAYKAKHGSYPDSLEDAGWREGEFGGRWRIVYKGNGPDRDPILMYPVTWIIFDMYDYNFESRQWVYLPD